MSSAVLINALKTFASLKSLGKINVSYRCSGHNAQSCSSKRTPIMSFHSQVCYYIYLDLCAFSQHSYIFNSAFCIEAAYLAWLGINDIIKICRDNWYLHKLRFLDRDDDMFVIPLKLDGHRQNFYRMCPGLGQVICIAFGLRAAKNTTILILFHTSI